MSNSALLQHVSAITSDVLAATDQTLLDYLDSVIVNLLQASKLDQPSDLFDEIGEVLVGYEEVSSDQEALTVCGKIVKALQNKRIIRSSTHWDAKQMKVSSSKSKKKSSIIQAASSTKLSSPVIIDAETEEAKSESKCQSDRNTSTSHSDASESSEGEGDGAGDEDIDEVSTAIDVGSMDFMDRNELQRELAQNKAERILMASNKGVGACAMCDRIMPLTKHHLIPRTTHKYYLKKGFTQEHLNTCVDICRPCHSAVHNLIDEKTLAKQYNTVEALLAHEGVQKFIAYAQKQKVRTKQDSMNPNIRYRKWGVYVYRNTMYIN